jgi:hypothetical protein
MVRGTAGRALTMAVTATTPTEFDISLGTGAPHVNPYSARGLRGSLQAIEAARGNSLLARTVNGTLIDISAPQMRKYRLEVTGSDQAPPALDGLWVGMTVSVYSHVELAYLTSGAGPAHLAAPGSARVEGAYTYYRPAFTMMIVDWHIEREEWEQTVPWSLVLEEV